MKRATIGVFLFAVGAWAQTGARSVVLTWQDSLNPPTTTYSVYRGVGACASDSLFARVVSGLSVKSHEDSVSEPGAYCYRVTATYKGLESNPSGMVTAIVPLAPPVALSVIVK